MIIRYDFKIKLKEFGCFLNHIAKNVKINSTLFYDNEWFYFVINDSEKKVLELNELIKKVPYFLFLQDYKISYRMIENKELFSDDDIKIPLNLCDEVFDDLAGFSEFNYEFCDSSEWCVIANYELLQKAFVCNKNTQIFLNSYEKPFVKLAVKKLYQKAHNLPSHLYVCFANNKTTLDKYSSSTALSFIKPPKNPLIIKPYNDTFCVINNPYTNDKIKAFNIDNLSFNLPKNKPELIKLISSLEHGEKLLCNYQKEFIIDEFELKSNKLEDFINLVSIILGKDILSSVPNTYQKGVRIDFVLDNNELNIARCISSMLSFKLANAMMIEVGFFEGLIGFIGKLNTDERYIYSKLIANDSFLTYNAFLNKHLKLSQWQNYECSN